MTLSLSCDRFRNGQLEGLVTETLSFCERDNVSREVFYHRGVRHGFYRSLPSDSWVLGRNWLSNIFSQTDSFNVFTVVS